MDPSRDEGIRRHTLQDWLGSWGAIAELPQGTKRNMRDYVFCALELLALSSPLARQNLQALEENQKLAPMLPFLRYGLTPACWWEGKSLKVAEGILSTESPQLFALLRSSERFLSSVVTEMETEEMRKRLSYEVLLPWMSALKREMSYDWNSYETLRELDIGKLPSTEHLRNLTISVKLLYQDGFLALPSSAIVIPCMSLPSSHTIAATRRRRAVPISSEDNSPKSHRFLLPGIESSEYHKKDEADKEHSELSSQLHSAEQEPWQEDGMTLRSLVGKNLSNLKVLANFIPLQKTPPSTSPTNPSKSSFKDQSTSSSAPMRSSPSILAAASEELDRWAEILEPELKGVTIRRIEHHTSSSMQGYGGETSHVTSHVEQPTHMPSDVQHTASVHPFDNELEEEFWFDDSASHSPTNGAEFEEDKPGVSEVNTGMYTPNKTSPKSEEDKSSVPPSKIAELRGPRRPSLTRFGIEELAMQQGSPWSPPRTSLSGLPQFSPIRVRTSPTGIMDVENNAAAPGKESVNIPSPGDVSSLKEERQSAAVGSSPESAPLSPPVTPLLLPVTPLSPPVTPLSPPVTLPVSPPKPQVSPVSEVMESPRYFQMPLSSPRYVRRQHSAFCDRPRVQPPGSPRGPILRESVLLQPPEFNESDHGNIGPDVPFSVSPKNPSKPVLDRRPTPRRGELEPSIKKNSDDSNIFSVRSSEDKSTPSFLLPSPPLSALEEAPPPLPQPTPASQESGEQPDLNSRRYLHPSQEPISSGTLSLLPSTDQHDGSPPSSVSTALSVPITRLPSLPSSSMQEPFSPLPQPKQVALKTCSAEDEEVCDDESLISAMGSVGLGFGPPPEIWIFRSPNSPRSPVSAASEGVANVVWDSGGSDRGASHRDFQNEETGPQEADESASSLAPVRTQRVLTRTWSTGETPEKISWIWSTGAFSPAVPKEKPRNRSPPVRHKEAVPEEQTLPEKKFSRSQTWASTPTVRDVPEQDVDVSQTLSAEPGLGMEPKWERSAPRHLLSGSSNAMAKDKALIKRLSRSSGVEVFPNMAVNRTWSRASIPEKDEARTVPKTLLRQNTWSSSSSSRPQSALQDLPETQSRASTFKAAPETGSAGSDQEAAPEQACHAQSAESNNSPTVQHKPLANTSPSFAGAREQQPSASGDVEEQESPKSASTEPREEVPQPKLLWRSWSAAIRQEVASEERSLNRSWSKVAGPIVEPAPELQSQQRSIAQVKVPDGLIRLLGHVYLFKACSSREEVLRTSMELKAQDEGVSVVVLNVYSPDGKRSPETEERHRITFVDYPPLYGGSAVLPLELTIAFIGLCNSCIVKGELMRMVVLHCEPGGWLVLAFLISVLFACLGDRPDPEKTLLSVLSDLPARLRSGKSEISPFPSQLRYLKYVVSGVREVITKKLIVKGVVLRHIPSFLIDQGGRSVVRFYGRHLDAQGKLQEGILYSSDCKAPSRLDNPEKEMVETNCQLSGDIVLDCIIRQYGMEEDSQEVGGLPQWLSEEQLIFRAVFNTAFYREGKPLELRTDDVDRPWGGHRFGLSSSFRAELWFRELTSPPNTTKTL